MKCFHPLALTALLTLPHTAYGFFVDGNGHYALRGETRTSPEFSKQSGTYQAVEQSFRLKGEARFNDLSSMYLEFRLLDNPREAYLGDEAEPENCRGKSEGDPGCRTRHQNTGEPSYAPYVPRITQAYVRYAFDYCIIEAGRRGRDWGLGIFMDSGSDPFETSSSVYDGVTCNVNIQKTQTLGFSVGYDKLQETGTTVDQRQEVKAKNERVYGANDLYDDVDQYFFTIEYDDRKANAGAAFTKQVGVYFSQVSASGKADQGGGSANTDLKFLDLYTGFFVGDLILRNEILFRMGKSADPNWIALGGDFEDDNSNIVTNKLDSIAFAGSIAWIIDKSGAPLGPAEYNQGDATQHLVFFDYAYAPGDEDGYFDTRTELPRDSNTGQIVEGTPRRNDRVTAVAFHRNYKPALLLFNARPEADELIVDGNFNPSRMMNASLLATGYRYESMANGNFEFKFISANLLQGTPAEVKAQYAEQNNPDAVRPVGTYGKHLGYELDLAYSRQVGKEATIGIAGGAALPGDAWKRTDNEKPVFSAVIQTFAAFRF
jgi:hypothetical protein